MLGHTIIDENTGLEICFETTPNMFPKAWYSETINAKAVSLEKKHHQRIKKTILLSLKKYPSQLIRENLKKIFLLQKIQFYGLNYGGTYSKDSIFITNTSVNFYIEKAFHHEFSHILFKNLKFFFKEKQWESINSKKFHYGDGGVEALKNNKHSQIPKKTFHKDGLLHEYATSALKEDFASIAENLFLPINGFKDLIDKYERIKQKRILAIEFYQRINKNLSQNYFDQILENRTE